MEHHGTLSEPITKSGLPFVTNFVPNSDRQDEAMEWNLQGYRRKERSKITWHMIV